MKHATVKLDGVGIPLSGVPPSATGQVCEICGDVFHL